MPKWGIVVVGIVTVIAAGRLAESQVREGASPMPLGAADIEFLRELREQIGGLSREPLQPAERRVDPFAEALRRQAGLPAVHDLPGEDPLPGEMQRVAREIAMRAETAVRRGEWSDGVALHQLSRQLLADVELASRFYVEHGDTPVSAASPGRDR